MNNDRLLSLANGLDRMAPVPTRVLVAQVVNDGACITALTQGKPPPVSGERTADRELAARVCSGCLRQWECVELELRWSGPHQVGAFGALPDEDRRALYPLWRTRRARGGDQR